MEQSTISAVSEVENSSTTSNSGEINTPAVENNKPPKSDNKSKVVIALSLVVALCGIGTGVYCMYTSLQKDDQITDLEEQVSNKNSKIADLETQVADKDEPVSSTETKKEDNNEYLAYRLSGNSLVEDFDLYFLQLENKKENKIYSPLSIKYALKMLEEGANGETKKQISNIVGDVYSSPNYVNSSNMSFANALFVRDSFKNTIRNSYVNTLTSKYNAEVIYDPFATANTINSWVSNKTFNLINDIVDDSTVNDLDFALVNALAIDMEWVNQIQSTKESYYVSFKNEKYYCYVSQLGSESYYPLDFNNSSQKAKSVQFGAVANKYDIVNVLGWQNIYDNIKNEYTKWLNTDEDDVCTSAFKKELNGGEDKDIDNYVRGYIKELDTGYKHISSSTEFKFYIDDSVKVFAKELKEYDGTTLQYIGIMPINKSLESFIDSLKASDINKLISNLRSIALDDFKDGVITEVNGYVPVFKYSYNLDLMRDLAKLGITDVFDSAKADLSGITSNSDEYISTAKHSANIEFTNDGIKAAATTLLGGSGAGGGCSFVYKYDVPVEKINLTFDNPYMFIIRDKYSGEVWFAGTVYEPDEYEPFDYSQL